MFTADGRMHVDGLVNRRAFPMSRLLEIGLANAAMAAALAAAVWLVTVVGRRPALAHGLWLLVLLRLIAPPLIGLPIGWRSAKASGLTASPEPAPIAVEIETETMTKAKAEIEAVSPVVAAPKVAAPHAAGPN